MDSTANDLFNLLVSRDYTVKTLDSQGKPVVSPGEAQMFSFDFETKNNNYGTVVILLDDESNFECYYGDNVGKNMEGDDKDAWYDFLAQLKNFATRNLLTFSLKNLNKLKYSMQGMAAINEGLFEGWNGTKHTSYNNKPGTTRLKIVHSKAIEEGEQRFRNIEKLYVENAEGERFKLPFTSLVAGRAMARHVAEGGTPYDVFGQHITDIVREANVLSKFTRATQRINEDDDQFEVVEAGRERYKTLRHRLKSLAGKRGYHAYKEEWNPAEIEEDAEALNTLRGQFTRETIDQRIEEALPYIMKQINEAGFANKLSPSGKVPVGLYTFVYSVVDPSRVQFIANSAEKRGMAVIAKGKNKLRIDGDAMQHSSLIYSLQQLGVEGEVKEKHTAQMDEGVYKKGKIAFKIAKGVLKYLPPVLIGTYLAVQDAEQQEKRDAEQKAGYAQQLQQPEQTKESQMKEFNQFSQWAEQVTEGTWAIPDDEAKIKQLKNILAEPLPVGTDAMNATGVLYDIIGDDELFDSLAELANDDPEADARPVIQHWIEEYSDSYPGLEDLAARVLGSGDELEFEEAQDFGARGMNKYGMSAVKGPDGFYALVNGKVVAGPFDSLEELKAYQEGELNKESVEEQLDIDTGEEQHKLERDAMLEMNLWRKLAGMQEKVYEDFSAFQEPQQQVEEGFSDTPLRDKEDYLEKSKALYDLLRDPSLFDDEEAQQAIQQRILRLNDEARKMGLIEMSETEYASKLEQDILEDWGSSDGTVLVKGIDDAIEKYGLNPDVIRQTAESLAEVYAEDMGYGDDIDAATDAVIDTWTRRSELGKRLAKLFSEEVDETNASDLGKEGVDWFAPADTEPYNPERDDPRDDPNYGFDRKPTKPQPTIAPGAKKTQEANAGKFGAADGNDEEAEQIVPGASDSEAEKKGDKELDERSLTKGEEKKREKYVKGMKKSKEDFKKRYGKRGEEVMYATATKMAKEGEGETTGGTNVFGKGIYESLTELEDDLDIALGNGITATSQLDKPENPVDMIEPDEIATTDVPVGIPTDMDIEIVEPAAEERNIGDQIADKGAELSAQINSAIADIKRLAGMGN